MPTLAALAVGLGSCRVNPLSRIAPPWDGSSYPVSWGEQDGSTIHGCCHNRPGTLPRSSSSEVDDGRRHSGTGSPRQRDRVRDSSSNCWGNGFSVTSRNRSRGRARRSLGYVGRSPGYERSSARRSPAYDTAFGKEMAGLRQEIAGLQTNLSMQIAGVCKAIKVQTRRIVAIIAAGAVLIPIMHRVMEAIIPWNRPSPALPGGAPGSTRQPPRAARSRSACRATGARGIPPVGGDGCRQT